MKSETTEASVGIILFIAAACLVVVSLMWVVTGTLIDLRVGMSEIQGDLRVLIVRMEGVEKNTADLKEKVNSVEKKKEKVNSEEVKVRSTNEYLRKSENQDVPKDTSASDLTPVSP